MKIAILKERRPHETRVAATPETVKKLKALGAEEIVIETGAGVAAAYTDQAYSDAGAMIVPDATAAAAAADVIFKIQRPMAAADGLDELALLRQGQVLMAPLGALTNKELVQALATKGVTSFALELIPRITRAQSMDALSSQANLAGYKAVLIGADAMNRILPMMTTAAGTLAPAKVFIVGAGVAGLQAVATARRLGAVVSAFDVRPVVKEQVQSLGATFVEAPVAAEGAGGYAKELSTDQQQRVTETLERHLVSQDLVVTTAQVPGRPAPRIITTKMVRGMKPASVIVDLAAESGGNCEPTRAGEVVDVGGVLVLGPVNVPSSVAFHASQTYSRNLQALLQHLLGKDGAPKLDLDDPITGAMALTHAGEIRKQP